MKGNSRLSHSLLRDMSKRTSEQLPNVLEIANPNHLEGGDEEEDVFEGSKVDSAAVDTPATGGDISCIQTTSGDYSSGSLWLIL